MAKFTAACKIHQSLLFDNGTDVGVGTTTPGATLDGNGNISGRDNISLPQTTKSTLGVITLGGSPFAHAFCSSSASNTFIGTNARNFTSTGTDHNTTIGAEALSADTTGSENTAAGYVALSLNNSGASNTAFGHEALENNTNRFNNTAVGFGACSPTARVSKTLPWATALSLGSLRAPTTRLSALPQTRGNPFQSARKVLLAFVANGE